MNVVRSLGIIYEKYSIYIQSKCDRSFRIHVSDANGLGQKKNDERKRLRHMREDSDMCDVRKMIFCRISQRRFEYVFVAYNAR